MSDDLGSLPDPTGAPVDLPAPANGADRARRWILFAAGAVVVVLIPVVIGVVVSGNDEQTVSFCWHSSSDAPIHAVFGAEQSETIDNGDSLDCKDRDIPVGQRAVLAVGAPDGSPIKCVISVHGRKLDQNISAPIALCASMITEDQ